MNYERGAETAARAASLDEIYATAVQSSSRSNNVERMAWVAVAFILILKPLVISIELALNDKPYYIFDVISQSELEILFNLFFLFFPYLFRNIFGSLPVELIRQNVRRPSITPNFGEITAGGDIVIAVI